MLVKLLAQVGVFSLNT